MAVNLIVGLKEGLGRWLESHGIIRYLPKMEKMFADISKWCSTGACVQLHSSLQQSLLLLEMGKNPKF